MPDEIKESQRMGVEHGATILATIYQSQAGDVGEGVCRGVIQHWLASYLDSIRIGEQQLLAVFRSDVSQLGKGKSSKFVALHDDWHFHEKKGSSDLSGIALRRGVPVITSHKQYSLGQITFYFDSLFPHNGLYYVSMEGHCFGLKREDDRILFIDANTCEFEIPTTRFRHKAFLVDYIATLYPDSIGNKLTTLWYRLA